MLAIYLSQLKVWPSGWGEEGGQQRKKTKINNRFIFFFMKVSYCALSVKPTVFGTAFNDTKTEIQNPESIKLIITSQFSSIELNFCSKKILLRPKLSSALPRTR